MHRQNTSMLFFNSIISSSSLVRMATSSILLRDICAWSQSAFSCSFENRCGKVCVSVNYIAKKPEIFLSKMVPWDCSVFSSSS